VCHGDFCRICCCSTHFSGVDRLTDSAPHVYRLSVRQRACGTCPVLTRRNVLEEHLSRQALGSPLLTAAQSTVASIYQAITTNQGGRIIGAAVEALATEVALIRGMVEARSHRPS